MKKRYLLSLATLAGAGIMYQKQRAKSNHFDTMARSKIALGPNAHLDETIKDAGIPDQVEVGDASQLENSKMVSEGSQFGVQYYNELTDRESKIRKKQK